jgi:gluconolactonase
MPRNELRQEVSHDAIAVFADGLDHPECVCWHPDGCLYAGGEAGQIYRISDDGRQVDEIARTGGFVLGLAVSPDRSWLAACDLKNQCVWKCELAGGRLSVLSRGTDNCPMRIPNHLAFDRARQLYVSDSGVPDKNCGVLFRVSPSGETSVWHGGPFHFANGLAIAPSHDALFVVCTWAGTIERVKFEPMGEPGERSTYLTLEGALPDGLAFDGNGDMYISCYTPSRIYRVVPGIPPCATVFADDWTDHLLCHPTNICFGGADGKTLFAANLGRWHIASISMPSVDSIDSIR